MNSGFESRSVWDLPWILDSLQTILEFEAEIKMAAGNYTVITECLPRQIYQGDSESLNPPMFSSHPANTHGRGRSAYMSGSWPWASGAFPSHPWDQNKVKTARNISGELGLWGRGICYGKDRKKRCHDSCLLSVWIFPKRSVFSLSHCVKRKNVLLVWDSQSKWASAEIFCELGSLSIAVPYLPQVPCKRLPLMEGIISAFF